MKQFKHKHKKSIQKKVGGEKKPFQLIFITSLMPLVNVRGQNFKKCFFWVQLCDLKNFEKLREHHVVDRPHPQHSRRGDRCHGEHVVGHEEGRRPDASPHTPLAQGTPLTYTVSLRKDTKREI